MPEIGACTIIMSDGQHSDGSYQPFDLLMLRVIGNYSIAQAIGKMLCGILGCGICCLRNATLIMAPSGFALYPLQSLPMP